MDRQYPQEISSDEAAKAKPQPADLPQTAEPKSIQAHFSPWRFLLITIGGIFLAEVIAMAFIYRFPNLPFYVQTLVDASLMVVLIFPIVYSFSLKPLLLHIEKHQQMENALRKSEERYALAYRSNPAALSISHVEGGRFIEVNDSFLRLFGYVRDEAVGHTADELDLYPIPEERDKLEWLLLKQRSVDNYEMSIRIKSGEVRNVSISTEAIELDGKVNILAIASDITERKHAEKQVQEMALFPALNPDVVLQVDALGMIKRSNPAAVQLGFYVDTLLTEIIPDLSDLDLLTCISSGTTQQVYETRLGERVLLWTIRGVPKLGLAFLYSIDITQRKYAEERLRRVNRALSVLNECNQILVRSENDVELLQQMCEIIVNIGEYRMAWVGFAEQDQARSVRPAAQFGFEDGYLDIAQITWADNERGRGPTGAAIREGVTQVNQNFLTNPRMELWRASALLRGYQSSIALPLRDESSTFGALTIYAPSADAFDEEEVELLNELANNLAFGITALRVRDERKHAEEKIVLERNKLKSILDTMQEGVYIVNQNYQVEYINPAIEREFGQIRDRKCYKFFYDTDDVCEFCANEQVFQGRVLNSERTFAASGKVYDLLDMPLSNSDGSISKLRIMHDITRLKENERKLQQANLELQNISLEEHKQRQLSDALVQAALILNRSLKLDDVLTLILEQVKEVIPYQLADIALLDGDSFYNASHHGYQGLSEGRAGMKNRFSLAEFPLLKEMRESGKPVLIADIRQESDWIIMHGLTWSRSFLSAPLLVEKEVIGFVNLFAERPDFFTQELSDRLVAFASHAAVAIQNAWLFEQVRASSERLHSLSRRLVEIQESERLYIARELHDEAGQMLTSLMVDLRMLEKKASEPDVVIRKIVEMERSLNEVLENLHRMAMALRPASLDHLGLVPALRQLVESVGEKHDLKVSFRSGGVLERLPANVETVLYRTVQEALTNVVRHAHATQVDVILTVRDGKLIVIVEDDGDGFDPTTVSTNNHLGLFGMRERTEMIDGKLVIESAPGKGTTILMEVGYADTAIGRR